MTNTSTNSDTPPTIRFRLTDNDLIVENFGENAKPFTRKGVISICYTSLSAKSNHITDLKCENSELPDKIGEELKQLKPNSRQAHISNETRTIKDYFGRFVLELLQNADDAVNKESDEMIGMKGLGFKSIFEITNEPEIRSGDFHFRLKKESDGLRIPECIKVVECAATTQIRLPFRDDAAKKSAQAAIGEIESMRAGILLFCQSLQRIDIEIDGLPSRRLEIRIVPRDDENIDQIRVDDIDQIRVDDIELVEKSGEEIISATWRRWLCKPQSASGGKHISAGVCLPLDNEGKISSCEKDESLRVFFPTEEQIEGARALIHASCEVDSNRKHLSDAKGPDCESICKMLRNLVKEILSSRKEDSAGALLRAFGEIKTAENPDDKKMVNRLGNAIAEAVRETAFVPVIGGDFVKPAEVCLWEFGIGKVLREEEIANEKLLAPDLEEEIRILDGLGASKIDDEKHARILRHCKNDSREKCIEAAKTAIKIAVKAAKCMRVGVIASLLREAPFWWAGKIIGRALNGEPLLLLERPVEWPDFIEFEALESDFSNELKTLATNADKTQTPENGDFNSLKSCDIWPLEPSDYFKQVLMPFCQGKGVEWWQDNGGKILSLALKWRDKPKIAEKAKQIFRLPTGSVEKQEWLVADDCYAGVAWGGPAHFDSFFKNDPNRGVVLPLKNWRLPSNAENSEEKWKPLLEQLGVSWMPKLRFEKWELLSPYDQDRLKQKCREILDKSRLHIRESGERVFIDDFPGSMGKNSAEILRAAKKIQSEMYKNSSRINFISGLSEIERIKIGLTQLRETAWLPCTPGYLSLEGRRRARPEEVYMPGCLSNYGLGGLLSEVNRGDIKDSEWFEYGFPGFLGLLGVRQNLSENSADFHSWMHGLHKRADELDSEDESLCWSEETSGQTKKRGKLVEIAKKVYARYLENFGKIPANIPTPHLRKTDKGMFIAFAPAREIFRLDEPYLAEYGVRQAVIEADKVFFFLLNDEKAGKSGLRLLSDHLKMERMPCEDAPNETELLCRIYEERLPILQAVIEDCCGKSKRLPKNIKIVACKGIRKRSTTFPKIEAEIEFDREGAEKLFVNAAGGDSRTWNSLAAGLAAISGVPERTLNLASLLMGDYEDCVRLLRTRFQLTEETIRGFVPEEIDSSNAPQENAEEAEDSIPDSGSIVPVERTEARSHAATIAPEENYASPKEADASPAAIEQPAARAAAVRDSRGYSRSNGGESDDHKKFKEWVAAHPEKIGIGKVNLEREYEFDSLHRVDLLFDLGDERIAVEVKSKKSSDSDVGRGIYQCVAYKALLEAKIKVKKLRVKARALLVIERDEFPPQWEYERSVLGVEVKVIPPRNSSDSE